MILLAAAIVLGALTATGTAAGQQPAPADPAQPLAFVIRYADGRIVRNNIGPTYSSWTPMFPRVDGWPDGGVLTVSAIRYRATRSEAGLQVIVSVLRGQPHIEESEIARVTLRDRTPVSIGGLAGVGVRPVDLWVEPGQLRRVYPPAVENRTASLDVASIEMLDGPPASMVVVVRNASAKAAVSYSVEVLGAGRRPLLGAWQAERSGQPVLEPGGSHTFRMSVADVPQPELLALASVQWTDGTFEGDAKPAASQWCRDAAGRAQIGRILALLRAQAATDLTTALTRLEALADGLEIVALPAMVAEVTARLPDPAPMTSEEAARTIASDLQRLKKEFIGELERARPRRSNAAATQEWFDAAIAAYSDRLSGLSTR